MSRRRRLSDGRNVAIEWSGVILTNRRGELLLNLRDPGKQLHPGMRDLIGGTLETGEGPEDCLIREVFEETGEKLAHFEWLKDLDVPLEGGAVGCLHLYSAVLDKPVSELLVGEGQEHRFVPVSELADLDIVPGIDIELGDFVRSARYMAALQS